MLSAHHRGTTHFWFECHVYLRGWSSVKHTSVWKDQRMKSLKESRWSFPWQAPCTLVLIIILENFELREVGIAVSGKCVRWWNSGMKILLQVAVRDGFPHQRWVFRHLVSKCYEQPTPQHCSHFQLCHRLPGACFRPTKKCEDPSPTDKPWKACPDTFHAPLLPLTWFCSVSKFRLTFFLDSPLMCCNHCNQTV